MSLRRRTDAYWQKRAEQRLLASERVTKKHMAQMAHIYAEARRRTVKSLQGIYAAYYKKDEGFDMQALRSIAPTGEIKQFLKEMKRLGLNTSLPENYNGRVSRLKLINAQLEAEAKRIATQQEEIDRKALTQDFIDSYYRAGFDVAKGLGSTPITFAGLDEQTMRQTLNAKFYGENFSQRIWKNSDLLASRLKQTLSVAIANGQGIGKTAAEVARDFNVNRSYAERLIRTESNHFHNEGELEAYKQMGFEEFRFLATLDNRTSEICRDMDNKVFKVEDGVPGENVPPLHPNCRSTIVPVFKGYEPETRLYRDPETGQNKFTYNVSFNEWKRDHEEALSPTGKRTDWSLIGLKRSKAETEIRRKKKETLLVLDDMGKVVHAEKGGEHEVRLSNKSRHLLQNKGYSASHNHPSCSSFSAADLKTAASYNLKNIRAVSKYRTFEVSAKGEWPSDADIERVHERNLKKARAKAMKWKTQTGSSPNALMWGELTHEAMKKTAEELNLNYKSTKMKE